MCYNELWRIRTNKEMHALQWECLHWQRRTCQSIYFRIRQKQSSFQTILFFLSWDLHLFFSVSVSWVSSDLFISPWITTNRSVLWRRTGICEICGAKIIITDIFLGKSGNFYFFRGQKSLPNNKGFWNISWRKIFILCYMRLLCKSLSKWPSTSAQITKVFYFISLLYEVIM